jgi:hypothetical protein
MEGMSLLEQTLRSYNLVFICDLHAMVPPKLFGYSAAYTHGALFDTAWNADGFRGQDE